MLKIKLFIIIIFFIIFKVNAQSKILTIDEVTEIVLNQSNRLKMLNNSILIENIESSFYRLSVLPKISSSISFPYQRSISQVIQSDGSLRFIERNYLNSSVNLTISQVLPFTGGTVSLSSSVNNAKDFNFNNSSFSSNWANISYQQTINGFNSYKWNKQLNTLKSKKDNLEYLREKIKLKYDVSKIYLETLLMQLKTELIKENIIKTEYILKELEEKVKYGRTIIIEVEQAKISLEQLKRQLEINEINYKLGLQSIKNLMNNNLNEIFSLEIILQDDFEIEKEDLIRTYKENGFNLEKVIKLLESNSNIEKVKKDGAPSINFQLGMGLNSSANNFSNLYNIPSQSQFVTVSTNIPILNWGKTKKNYEKAKLEKENLQLQLKEKEEEIEEKIDEIFSYKLSLISQKKSLNEQIKLSKNVSKMYDELLKSGRKTITEYITQLTETYNITIEYQKTVNNLYLLKLKINEFNLIY